MWHEVNFKAEYSWFEFRVFLHLDWLPLKKKKKQFALLYTHWWGVEKRWIHMFLKDISIKGNTNNSWLWFELRLLIPFPKVVTVTLHVFHVGCVKRGLNDLISVVVQREGHWVQRFLFKPVSYLPSLPDQNGYHHQLGSHVSTFVASI